MPDYTDQEIAVISRYDVPSDRQGNLATDLNRELQNWISNRPGFVSGTVYSSIDQLHIVVCTVWRTEVEAINYLQVPEAKEIWAIITSSGAIFRDSHKYWIGEAVMPKRLAAP
jgi:heme-degrading monooxygenase HmoA